MENFFGDAVSKVITFIFTWIFHPFIVILAFLFLGWLTAILVKDGFESNNKFGIQRTAASLIPFIVTLYLMVNRVEISQMISEYFKEKAFLYVLLGLLRNSIFFCKQDSQKMVK